MGFWIKVIVLGATNSGSSGFRTEVSLPFKGEHLYLQVFSAVRLKLLPGGPNYGLFPGSALLQTMAVRVQVGPGPRALWVHRHGGDKLAAAKTEGVLWECHCWLLNHHPVIGFIRPWAWQIELFSPREPFHNAGNPSQKANHQEGESDRNVTHDREAPLMAGS